MLTSFIKHNSIDINIPLGDNHKGTTIEKIQKYIANHWGLYKPNFYINLCSKSNVEFDPEYFIDSWKTIPPGDFIEQYARKMYIYQVKTNELFDFALTALNSKCLSINIVDIEVLLYVLYAHVKYNLPFTNNTINLLIALIDNQYADYMLITCYILMKLLPHEITHVISKNITNKLSSKEVIDTFVIEPWTLYVFYEFVNMINIPHSINAVIVKHVFKNALYLYLPLFTSLSHRTITTLKNFCYKHFDKVKYNRRVWYLLSQLDQR